MLKSLGSNLVKRLDWYERKCSQFVFSNENLAAAAPLPLTQKYAKVFSFQNFRQFFKILTTTAL